LFIIAHLLPLHLLLLRFTQCKEVVHSTRAKDTQQSIRLELEVLMRVHASRISLFEVIHGSNMIDKSTLSSFKKLNVVCFTDKLTLSGKSLYQLFKNEFPSHHCILMMIRKKGVAV
jgi:hypothetical protein